MNSKNIVFTTYLILIFINWGIAQMGTQVFNYTTQGATQTFTIPNGYTADIEVEVWGGGGGIEFGTQSRGGGGGGGYCKKTLINVPEGSYSLIIGKGGLGQQNGETSTITIGGFTLNATGGEFGRNTYNYYSVGGEGSNGDINNTGGSGGARSGSTGGGGGGAAGPTGNGGNGGDGIAPNGGVRGIGNNTGGNGGAGGPQFSPGFPGVTPGGGAGGRGSSVAQIHQQAGHGRIIINYSFMPLLPIELISFTATSKHNNIILDWTTASEINNHFFEIGHSTDGERFNTIGKIPGHGNVSEPKDYQYTHDRPSAGINYYRIKQVDYDGKYTFSDIQSVIVQTEGNDVSIYPNPVTSIINVIDAEGVNYSLYDLVGRQIKNGQISNDVIEIDHLPKGMYYLHLDNDPGKSVHKIWKE